MSILQSWDEVELWYHSPAARHQTIFGFISYEQGYEWMGLKAGKADKPLLPKVWFRVTDNTLAPTGINPAAPRAIKASGRLRLQPGSRTYTKQFKQVMQHLKLGDIYQANLSYRLELPYRGTAQQLYTQLSQAQPTPYAALIETPDWSIVSNSPELFLRITQAGKKRQAEMRPMKGTRPAGQKYYHELLTSKKDQAELDMIIDVHRNDLARTAMPGSVRVTRRRQFLKLKTVWQTQAIIRSTIDPHYSSLEVIRSCFPAGSVTGAPKLRAMEIIHQLEPRWRNVYCGAIGYIKGNGDVQLSVGIRTAILKNNRIYYSIGSGITVDSIAKTEYNETLSKATTLFTKHHSR